MQQKCNLGVDASCVARLIEITKYFEAEMTLLRSVKYRGCYKTLEKQQALLEQVAQNL